jgi:hypothetical protein
LNKSEALHEIAAAIKNGGQNPDEYDLDEIFDVCYARLSDGRLVCAVMPEQFWRVVESAALIMRQKSGAWATAADAHAAKFGTRDLAWAAHQIALANYRSAEVNQRQAVLAASASIRACRKASEKRLGIASKRWDLGIEGLLSGEGLLWAALGSVVDASETPTSGCLARLREAEAYLRVWWKYYS